MEPSFARRERAALCDLALALGPDAATLCEGWAVADLIHHLSVRERPWLSAKKPADDSFPAEVERVRTPPLLLDKVTPLDTAMNALEYFVHHEDIRRARSGWEPRTLPPEDRAALLRPLGIAGGRVGKVLVRAAGVPVVVSDGTITQPLGPGDDPVTVSGPASEIVLFLFGRDEVRGLSFDGPAERVEKLKAAKRGF